MNTIIMQVMDKFVLLGILVLSLATFANSSSDVCRRDKCSSGDCEVGYDCSGLHPVGKVPEGYNYVEEFTCFDGYVGRAYENLGPILHRFTCCPPDFEGNPLTDDAIFNSENICAPWAVYNNSCSDYKCSSTFQKDCWIVTEYGKFYYGNLEADEMQCTDGYKPVLLEDKFALYTCCPPDYDGPVTVNFLPMPTVLTHTAICGVLTCLNIIAFIIATLFIISILSSRKTSYEGFNLYMVMLVVPDMLVNLSSAVYTGYRTHSYDETLIPGWLYKINFWLLFFYFVCNFWLNAIVAFEIHNLMLRSHRRMRTRPPGVKKVLLQSMITYFLSGLVATWYVINVPWSPYTINVNDRWNYHGSPSSEKVEYEGQKTGGVFPKEASLAIWFCIILLPAIYVIYVRVSTWWKQLLPVSGRTRVISLYFLRILFVFFGFYIPGVIIREVFLDWYGIERAEGGLRYWLWYCASLLLILQSLVTLFLAMSKPDIKERFSTVTSIKSMKSFRSGEMSMSFRKTKTDSSTTTKAVTETINDTERRVSEWVQDDVYVHNIGSSHLELDDVVEVESEDAEENGASEDVKNNVHATATNVSKCLEIEVPEDENKSAEVGV